MNYFKTHAPELNDERAMLLEEWLNTEASFGDLGNVNAARRHIACGYGPAGYGTELIFLLSFTSASSREL